MRHGCRSARSRSRPITLRVDRRAPIAEAERSRRTLATTARRNLPGRAPTASHEKCAARPAPRDGAPICERTVPRLQIEGAPVKQEIGVEWVAGIVEDQVAGPEPCARHIRDVP